MRTKLLGLLLAIFLVFGFAGQGMAAIFNDGDLVRVVYDYNSTTGTSANTWYTDLGSLSSLTNTHNNIVGSNISDLTGTALSNLQVAYFAYNSTALPIYIGGAGTLTRTGSSISSLDGGLSSLQTSAGPFNAGSPTLDTVKDPSGNQLGYWIAMNGSGAYIGSYSQFLAIGAAEASLNGLTSTGIKWGLTAFTGSTALNSAGTLYTNSDGSQFVIQTFINTDGKAYTEINPSAVPIPGAVWLLGSGLLGLIGIRRRVRNQ